MSAICLTRSDDFYYGSIDGKQVILTIGSNIVYWKLTIEGNDYFSYGDTCAPSLMFSDVLIDGETEDIIITMGTCCGGA